MIIHISAGYDLVTGRQLMLTCSAETEDAAILIRATGCGSRFGTARPPGRTSHSTTCSTNG